MHELSIAQALIEQIEQVAAADRAVRVRRVVVSVGALSGVDPDALEIAFPVAAESTVADGAELRIELVSAAAWCKACQAPMEPDFPFFVCTTCGSSDVEITGGRDLLLTSVQMDIDDGPPETTRKQ